MVVYTNPKENFFLRNSVGIVINSRQIVMKMLVYEQFDVLLNNIEPAYSFNPIKPSFQK